MLLIDTHAHLYYDNMYENLSEVLRLAESNHVKKIICIGTDLETSLKSVEIAEQYENVFATVGIHPHDSCLLYTSPSPRDKCRSRMPSSA